MFRSFLCFMLFAQSVFASSSVLGIYDLEVNINNNVFKDVLFLKTVSSINLYGEFEVPGNFRVPFLGEFKEGKILGEFKAKENGNEFKVLLEASLMGNCRLRGKLIQNEVEFAKFSGEKRGCHE